MVYIYNSFSDLRGDYQSDPSGEYYVKSHTLRILDIGDKKLYCRGKINSNMAQFFGELEERRAVKELFKKPNMIKLNRHSFYCFELDSEFTAYGDSGEPIELSQNKTNTEVVLLLLLSGGKWSVVQLKIIPEPQCLIELDDSDYHGESLIAIN